MNKQRSGSRPPRSTCSPNLTNMIGGVRDGKPGRIELRHLVSIYDRKSVRIREPAILIRVNRRYHYGISETELYDSTRGSWKVGPKRERAKYAFSVFEGTVREVYAIKHWLPAGSTYSTRNPRGVKSPGRWEFVGVLADDKLRRKYVERYVGHYFEHGAQNPITYVNVG